MLKRLIPLLALTLAAPAYAGGGSGIIKGLGGAAAQSIVTCPADDPISTLTPGFSCSEGPLTFSGFTLTGAPADGRIQFGTLGPLFAVTLSRDGAFFAVGRTVLDYTVTIAMPNHIVEGSAGIDVSFPPVIDITTMNGQLVTANGMPVTFPAGTTSVVVDNSATVVGAAELNSITNDFTERMVGVAEPSMLALLVMGLAGLGLARLVRPS